MAVKVTISGRLLKSLIDNRGIPIQVVAAKSGVNEADLQALLNSGGELDLPKVERLARVFQKPWTVFLLDEPERSFEYGQDNRTLKNQQSGLGPELIKALEDADFILDVAQEIDSENKQLPSLKANLDYDPKTLAKEARRLLKVHDATYEKFADGRTAFNYWKDIVQESGIYVSERPLPLGQVRAFSLMKNQRGIIVLSTKDTFEARSFSLFHEFCHILLRNTGLCDIGDSNYQSRQLEWYCNDFSASFLAPEALVRKLADKLIKKISDDKELINAIASQLKISKAATSIRLEELGYIKTQKKLDIEALPVRRRGAKAGGGNYYATAINAAGVRFSKSVFNALAENIISKRDASRFLGVGEKNIDQFRNKLFTYHPEL